MIYAIFKTGLSEELFFRGFLGKRFISKFGFNKGNFIQAFLFGLIHGVLFFNYVGIIYGLLITFITGWIGWIMGYINEKESAGSIFPSWGIHSVMNIVSTISVLFCFAIDDLHIQGDGRVTFSINLPNNPIE